MECRSATRRSGFSKGRTNPNAEDVIAHVDEMWGTPCSDCGRPLIGHEAVLGLMLGFSDEPVCADHLAERHDRSPVDFLRSAQRNVARLACYRAGWLHSDARLAATGAWPEDRIPSRLRMDPEDDEDSDVAHAPRDRAPLGHGCRQLAKACVAPARAA